MKTGKPKAVEEFLDYYFYRRVAALMVPVFFRWGFSPNAVTTLSLVMGLVSAALIYKHHYLWSVFFFLISIFFDCVDGQLARLTGSSGPLGRVLDGFFDLVVVVFVWVAIYLSGVLGTPHPAWTLPFLIFTGVSMALHCWRYDNVKIKSLELVEEGYRETDLDVESAQKLARQKFESKHYFEAFLAYLIAFQMYWFVRGEATKKKINLTFDEREKSKLILEPHMRFWSWLGIGHHNTLIWIGLLMAPYSPWGLWFGFFFMAVPMNVAFIIGEWRFNQSYTDLRKSLAL